MSDSFWVPVPVSFEVHELRALAGGRDLLAEKSAEINRITEERAASDDRARAAGLEPVECDLVGFLTHTAAPKR